MQPDPLFNKMPTPTKWLTFYNYLWIPINALVGFFLALGMFESNLGIAIFLLVFSILQCLVVYGLHIRKLWAWKWNWVILIATYCFALIPTQATAAEFIGRLLGATIIWMVPNYIYWKRRKHLFQ